MKTLLYIVIPAIILFSCTMEKRLYRPGWHAEWNRKAQQSKVDRNSPVKGKSAEMLEVDERFIQKPEVDSADTTKSPTYANEPDEEIPVSPDTITNRETEPDPIKDGKENNIQNGTMKKNSGKKLPLHRRAIQTFVLGWLFFVPIVGMITMILSIPFAISAISQINRSKGEYRGTGLVILGLIPVVVLSLLLISVFMML